MQLLAYYLEPHSHGLRWQVHILDRRVEEGPGERDRGMETFLGTGRVGAIYWEKWLLCSQRGGQS